MKRDGYLKHLDRAFTEMPPELTASVEEAFRRGEEAMKQRHKIMTALSVAAAIAVLCAAIALAAGTMLKPRRDNVVAARGTGTAEEAEAQPAPVQPGDTYFATLNGRYYHLDEHCGGMENAMPITGEAARAAGKAPCPVCAADEMAEAAPQGEEAQSIRDETPQPEEATIQMDDSQGSAVPASMYAEHQVYYATREGMCFHIDEHCQGMRNALPISWDAAWIKGKWACPVCVDEDKVPHLWLYCTSHGVYFHLKADCSGMKDGQRSYPAALQGGKWKPCPVCVPDDLFAFCWATPEGQYYHTAQDCMGMKTARIYTEMGARRQGKTLCPVCGK